MPVCIGGKWGFADNMGNIVIKAGYKWVDTFYNGTAYASNDFSWWFIDHNGDRIKGNSRNLRDLNWSGASCTFSSGGLHAARKGSRLGYIDNEYEIVIPFEYDFNQNAAGRRGRFLRRSAEHFEKTADGAISTTGTRRCWTSYMTTPMNSLTG